MSNFSLGRGSRPLRIGYGRLFHEANAFSPLVTTIEDFDRIHSMSGDELARATTLRGVELKAFMPHAELTGFRQAANLAGGVDTVPLQSHLAVPGGPVTKECFEGILDSLLRRIDQAGRLDGVYLALHGSMQVAGLNEAPEAKLLREVRTLMGRNAKIAVSYDLHANVTPGIVDPVDVLIAYRSNPHWDLAPTGFRAGNRLIRALRDQCTPTHAWRKMPMVLGGGMTIDFVAPMRSVFWGMRRLEDDPRVLSASLFMVHPYTNAELLGWAVHVCTDNNQKLADELAEQLADNAWAQRNVEPPPMRTVDEALDEVALSLWRRLGPVTFVDVDDIVGAGAPGGNTRIVEALVRDSRNLVAYVPVHDPALVEQLWDEPSGTRHEVILRGTPGYNSPEVTLNAMIGAKTTGDCGKTIRLDVGSFYVIITERPPLPIHPSFWSAVDLDARKADVIVQKNFFHYRMFYITTSFRHLPVESGGATSLHRVRNLEQKVPTHPRHKLNDWRSADPILRGLSTLALGPLCGFNHGQL